MAELVTVQSMRVIKTTWKIHNVAHGDSVRRLMDLLDEIPENAVLIAIEEHDDDAAFRRARHTLQFELQVEEKLLNEQQPQMPPKQGIESLDP